MANDPNPKIVATRPSPFALAAGLIALGTFFAITGGALILPALALALVATYLTNVRLETNSIVRWMVRLALIGLIVMQNQGENRAQDYMIGSANFRSLIGQVYAAEMVVQAWRRRADSGHVSLAVTFFSGLVFLTACNTFEDRLIWLVAPFYLLFIGLALVGHRPRRMRDAAVVLDPLPSDRRRVPAWTATAMRAAALTLALVIGFVGYRLVRAYRGELNDLGSRMLVERRFFESSGMASRPQLGSTFDLRGSPARVLRVSGLQQDNHLRGVAFDTYELGGRWGPGVRQRSFSKVTLNELSESPGQKDARSGPRLRQDLLITRLVSDNPLLYAPLGSVAVDPGEAEDTEWAPDAGGPIRTRTKSPYLYVATVTSNDRYQGPLTRPRVPRDGSPRNTFLQVPEGEEMNYLRDLARRITQRAKTPQQKADAVVHYLLANHHYSLSTQVGPGDPVVSFLRDKKDAHCEFFAASAALLLRCVGVPTRYVTGYYAHEEESEGTVIVRQRDAHAWTEIWIDGVGWAWIDATPGDGRPDYKPEAIPSWRRGMEWLQDQMQKLRDTLADLPPAALNFIVVTIAVTPLAYYILRNLWLRRRRGALGELDAMLGYTAAPADVAEIAARFEARFARSGVPFPPQQTWQEFLTTRLDEGAGAAEVRGDLFRAGMDFAHAYDAVRFGGQTSGETADRLARLLNTVERAAEEAEKKKEENGNAARTA